MAKDSWVGEQAVATEALIAFIRDHDGSEDRDLSACLEALRERNIDVAVRHALRVKPYGMGGLTDWWPSPKRPGESEKQLTEKLFALVNDWCRLMALSFVENVGG